MDILSANFNAVLSVQPKEIVSVALVLSAAVVGHIVVSANCRTWEVQRQGIRGRLRFPSGMMKAGFQSV
jgi:hypothetical protein